MDEKIRVEIQWVLGLLHHKSKLKERILIKSWLRKLKKQPILRGHVDRDLETTQAKVIQARATIDWLEGEKMEIFKEQRQLTEEVKIYRKKIVDHVKHVWEQLE